MCYNTPVIFYHAQKLIFSGFFQGKCIIQNAMNSLSDACSWGDFARVKELVEQGENIDTINRGFTKAARYGHLCIVKYLYEQGADIHTYHDWAFRCAAEYGHLDVVKYLVDRGANIHSWDIFGIGWVMMNGHLEVIKYLVQEGIRFYPCTDSDDALTWVVEKGFISTFIYMSSFYEEQELRFILSKQHRNKSLISFYNLMHFFLYQEHTELPKEQAELWDGNIGLIVASLVWK